MLRAPFKQNLIGAAFMEYATLYENDLNSSNLITT